jgi:hypothetical protein
MNNSHFKSKVAVAAVALFAGFPWVALAEDAPHCTMLSSLESPECARLHAWVETIQGQSVVSYRGAVLDSSAMIEASMACDSAFDAQRLPENFADAQSVMVAVDQLTENCVFDDFDRVIALTSLVLNATAYHVEAVVRLSNGVSITVIDTVPLNTTELMIEAESQSEHFLFRPES